MKFKVGDRVRFTGDCPTCTGKTATITAFSGDFAIIEGEGITHKRWQTCCIECVPLPVIVITSDGTTTTATMRDGKQIVKSATAKCNPTDTYDFETGARLAFGRLIGKDINVVSKSEIREFSRPAKVGEWIKILPTSIGTASSHIGEMFLVNDVTCTGLVHVETPEYGYAPVCRGEYVVLEGYEPPKEDKQPLEVLINGVRYVKEKKC
jgi:hypothetical protein